ncbi:hypothetical protein BCR44DRAFT_1021128 [Catenaria anguillulae PL171]|uniref:Uncharacterized protein n=1 Tax=Catenaria anguillulae PL171 TaxID=765915 RepID=A0A1Y2H819_9FUNG|nr:hypothetical protein BCR44DRAFT_1021128 [Catenaria anguillulae PL171]
MHFYATRPASVQSSPTPDQAARSPEADSRRFVSTLPGMDPTSTAADQDPIINLSFTTLASLFVTSTLGLVLGSLAAIGLSHALEATGVFAYVDEDEEGDNDADEGAIDDGNANVVIGNVDLTFAANEVANVGKGGEEARRHRWWGSWPDDWRSRQRAT